MIDRVREANITHGLTKTGTYKAWQGMLERCNNPNGPKYYRYGGRGITVCSRWNSFEEFLSDMGLRPNNRYSLDRINNNGNYEPGNCRWATRIEQAGNRSDNHLVTIGSDSKTVTEWSRISGVNRVTISDRLKSNWDPQRAVFHTRQEAA